MCVGVGEGEGLRMGRVGEVVLDKTVIQINIFLISHIIHLVSILNFEHVKIYSILFINFWLRFCFLCSCFLKCLHHENMPI